MIMNRTDRLLAIVLELQAKGQQRAEDLAAIFETSKRTIYRDVQALSEAGVPIVSIPGQGYSLVEGYFLPPLRFSAEEAIMLLLGSDFMAQNFDERYRTAAITAGRKIEAVLPDLLRADVHDLQGSIRFIASGALDDPAEIERLQQLRRALIERKRVRFQYQSRFTGDPHGASRPREADPYGLVHVNGAWYLIAYDQLRGDVRRFRLDRMDRLSLLDKHFTRPPDFKLQPPQDEAPRTLVIRALFDREIARWVKESHFFYVVDEQENADGLWVTLRVRQESEALQWLLSWGSHVQVLEPDSLRQRLAEEAEGILRIYQDGK